MILRQIMQIMSNLFEKRLKENDIEKGTFNSWVDNRIKALEKYVRSNLEILDPRSFAGRSSVDLDKTILMNNYYTQLNSFKKAKILIANIESGVVIDKQQKGEIEAIILSYNRPALFVLDGQVQEADSPIWNTLAQKREIINKTINSVGRIEVEGHPLFTNIGTAFLVGENTIMTNRHVVMAFGNEDLNFKSGISSYIDYKGYAMPMDEEEYKIEKILGIHSVYDLALLKISRTGENRPPLSILGREPNPADDQDIYVCGYPGYPSNAEANEANVIFGGIYNVKRVQPGKSLPYEVIDGIDTIGHDCTTLKGNSGSPVVDLKNNVVIGLHYFGTYKVKNLAIPLWKLSEDPMLINNGVTFSDQ